MSVTSFSASSNRDGQVLTEFAFFSVIVAIALASAGLLLRDEWYRSQCAYFVFESVHSRLIGRSERVSPFAIEIAEDEDRVRGVGHCGKAVERVELPKLEAARW